VLRCFYSKTTFIRDMRTLLQIRQVAHLRSGDMQPARFKLLRWCLGAFYSITTFIRAITSLLQIQQFAQLRSTTCSLQGLSSTQRSARAAPSRDRTLGAMQLVTLRSPGAREAPPPPKDDSKEPLDEAWHPPQARRTTGPTPSQ
jgi:hypothetical protein